MARKLKLNREYRYNTLKASFSGTTYEEIEHGHYVIGERFLVFKDESRDVTYSFVLTGATESSGIYKLIYKD